MTNDFDDLNDNDPTAARLRAALNAEAAMTNPADDGLANIRARTSGARTWWQHPGVLAVAAAALIGVVVGGGVALLGGGEDGGTVVADQTSEAATPTPSASASPDTGSPSPTPSPVPMIYVYYVMDDPTSGPRLYREQVESREDLSPGVAALQAMFSTPPRDPDYGSLWPRTTRLLNTGQAYGSDALTLNLSDWPDGPKDQVAAAVQQLVYTYTANEQSVKELVLQVNGAAPPGDVAVPVSRAPMVDVQGLIWLLSPTEGETVSSPVKIDGYGTAFEGTISWEVRRNGTVVAEGFTQGGSMGEFGEFSDTVDLEPGTYELRAFESSAEDGRPIHVDTKTFTVR